MPIPRPTDHALSKAFLMFFLLSLAGCATLERPATTPLQTSIYYKNVLQDSFESFEHSAIGSSFDVRHEDRDGVVYTMHVAAQHVSVFAIDSTGESDRFVSSGAERQPRAPGSEPGFTATATRKPYWLSSMGIGIGYHLRYVGLEVGLHAMTGPSGNDDSDSFPPLPWLEIRLGDMKSSWAELRIGSKSGLNDGFLAYLGGTFVGQHLRGSLGFGLNGNIIAEPGIELDGGEMAGLGRLEWMSKNGWGIGVLGVVGESYMVQTSLVMDLEKVFTSEL
jgi:hypothetical protein